MLRGSRHPRPARHAVTVGGAPSSSRPRSSTSCRPCWRPRTRLFPRILVEPRVGLRARRRDRIAPWTCTSAACAPSWPEGSRIATVKSVGYRFELSRQMIGGLIHFLQTQYRPQAHPDARRLRRDHDHRRGSLPIAPRDLRRGHAGGASSSAAGCCTTRPGPSARRPRPTSAPSRCARRVRPSRASA